MEETAMDRALLVGINEYPASPLRGCINDIIDVAAFLTSQSGFTKDSIRMLTDARATTQAIIARLGWLLTGVAPGDRVLFQFSGHGTQMPTRNPQGEVNGLDEAICPVDFDWSDDHAIRDKEFNKIFSAIPEGVHFVWISDSCHSGDLSRGFYEPRDGNAYRKPRFLVPPVDIQWRVQTAKEKKIEPESIRGVAKQLHIALNTGCRAEQTSADAAFEGRASGAMTYCLLRELQGKTGLRDPLHKIVPRVSKALANEGFEQDPQLEGSQALHSLPFFGKKKAKPPKKRAARPGS